MCLAEGQNTVTPVRIELMADLMFSLFVMWLYVSLCNIAKPGMLQNILKPSSNWSLFKLIISDHTLIKLKRIFAFICEFQWENV